MVRRKLDEIRRQFLSCWKRATLSWVLLLTVAGLHDERLICMFWRFLRRYKIDKLENINKSNTIFSY